MQNLTQTWSDYLNVCSGERIIENQVHALHEFTQTYQNNIVDWDGYYIDTKYKHKNYSWIGSEYFMSILIKMDPSESENFADVVLSISQEAYKNNKDVLDSLEKGDHLVFRAKMKTMGNEFKLHHLKLLEGDMNTKTIKDSGHTKDLSHISIQDTRIPWDSDHILTLWTNKHGKTEPIFSQDNFEENEKWKDILIKNC